MIVSMNWIKDFVCLQGEDVIDLIKRFTLSTAEVEEIICKGDNVTGIITAKIVGVTKHPESKKLHLVKVDTGSEIVDVVCGAPNVRENMVIPFAPVGSVVGGTKINAATLAGQTSYGMCCSEKELGISDDHSGLMELAPGTPLGVDIKELYDIEDVIFDVDNKSLTNRPDLWGHYGIAREFAALAGKPLKPLDMIDCSKYDKLEPVEIDIQSPDCAFRYSGIKIRNVTEKVSPVNMRIRLYYCGMRSINLLADLTNYLMLEIGQPMHAFDIRKVSSVEIRKYDQPFSFTTLDGVSRQVDENTLMISTNGNPIAIAGIMGGYDSEIVDDTDGLLLESANFDAVCVRKTSTRLGLRTDASIRYEKTLDPQLTTAAIGRFLKLLMEIDGEVQVISALSDAYPHHYPQIAFSFDKAYVNRYTGISIPNETIVNTLASLGFEPALEGDTFHITVPSWRATKDVSIKADIIEEITRIYGYDNFEVKSTSSMLSPVGITRQKRNETLITDLLVTRYNLHEVHSYLWCEADKLKKIGIDVEDNIKLINSTESANSTLRNSMVPTLLCAVYENQYDLAEFGVFEIGKVVEGTDAQGICNERKKLGIVLYSRQTSEKDLYFRLNRIIEYIIGQLTHRKLTWAPLDKAAHAWQHPVNSANLYCDGNSIGYLSILHPAVRKNMDLINRKAPIEKKAAVVAAQLDMEAIANLKSHPLTYAAPSDYPAINIDLSLLMKEATNYHTIASIVQDADSEYLQNVELIDFYESQAGESSITIRLTFVSNDRSLQMEEVQTSVNGITKRLQEHGIFIKGV